VVLLVDIALARRLDEALTKEGNAYVEAWARMHPESGAEALRVGDGWALFTGIDSPVTQAIGLGRAQEVTTADLDATEAFLAERGAVTRVNLSPFAHPSLAAELGRRGYRVEEFENAMVRTLTAVDDSGVDGSAGPGTLRVRPLLPEDVDEWAAVVARGFASLPQTESPTQADVALARLTPNIANVTSFAAHVEGRIVAGGSLSLHDGTATMFGDATLPEWRGRGAQTALLRARLQMGLRAGCDLATAGASPGSTSQLNMERLGFRVAYTQAMMVRDSDR
jgi:GNAT superfamily N-acetyltransferase